MITQDQGGSPPCEANQLLDYDSLNVEKIRRDFPILNQEVHGKKLVYMDNAASTQKPLQVIDTIRDYYLQDHSNVHRGVHALSQRATSRFDEARRTAQRFINARDEREVIWTKGCTEAINLVAHSWGRSNLKEGDVILLSGMEHHADIVPWQIVASQTGARVEPIPITDSGEIDLALYEELLDERVKLVGVVHVSNSLGTINPIKEMAQLAHSVGARFLADGAQAMAHMQVDVQDLDVDFFTISGHKVYGPTGIGALYGRLELLEEMPPYQAGGDMIRTVSFEETTYADLPNRFEPGTPNVEGVLGLAAALDYVQSHGIREVGEHECRLREVATQQLQEIEGLRIVGTAENKAGIISFTLENAHPHDIGTILDSEGVAVRAGHHCTMPLMKRFGIPATTRASFAMYNTMEEVDTLISSVRKVKEMFA